MGMSLIGRRPHTAGTERKLAGFVEKLRQGGGTVIGEGRSDQRYALWQTVRQEAAGNGDRGEIGEIDEVRVGPEFSH